MLDVGVQCQCDRGVFGGAVAVRDRSSEGAAVADLEVADQRGRAGQQRDRGRDLGGAPDRRVRSARADPHRVAALFDAAQFCGFAQVYEVIEYGEPQVEHGHQALSARDELCFVAQFGDERDRVGCGAGCVIVERRGFHAFTAWTSSSILMIVAGDRGKLVTSTPKGAKHRRPR